MHLVQNNNGNAQLEKITKTPLATYTAPAMQNYMQTLV